MARKMKEGEMDEELIEAFKSFDRDNNGFIVLEELMEILKSDGENLSDEEITLMFEEADEDGSGQITFEKFVKMMMAK